MTRHRKHVKALRNGQKAPLQRIQRTEHQGINGEETGILATKGRSFGEEGEAVSIWEGTTNPSEGPGKDQI